MERKLLLITAYVFLLIVTACSSSTVEKSTATESVQTAPVDPPVGIDKTEDSSQIAANAEGQSEMAMDDAETQSESADISEEIIAEDDIDDSMSDIKNDTSMMESEDDESMQETMADEEEMVSESSGEIEMVDERPAWHHEVLVNARTGEAFTLADFEGKTIFVEPMATWCSRCREQLTNVRQARLQLSREDVVFIALSVETNIDNSTLASYADGSVFDWLFAVVTPELLRQLADEFGQTITNPPATPHFIIRSDGTNTELVTGIDSADQIVSQITAAQG